MIHKRRNWCIRAWRLRWDIHDNDAHAGTHKMEESF